LGPNSVVGAALGGTVTVKAVRGVATFQDLTLNDVGDDFLLQASATGVASATSKPIDVVNKVTLTWTGKGNGKWSDPKDWLNQAGVEEAPAPSSQGENLVFPAGALHRKDSTNDLSNLTVSNLEFDADYEISGTTALTLNGNVNVTAGQIKFDTPISLP